MRTAGESEFWRVLSKKGERDDFFVLLMQNEKVRTGSKPDDKCLCENLV